MDSFRELRLSYMNSFTAHGVSRCIMGRALEKWYWGFLLLASLMILSYLCYGNFVKYVAKDIKTETEWKVQEQFELTRLIVCFGDLSIDFS